MAASDQDTMVLDLARELVAQVAPQELPLFVATSQAYLKNPQKINQKGADEMLGFGVNEAAAFMTPILIAGAREVIVYLVEEARKTLKTESTDAINTFIKNQFKKLRPAEKPVEQTAQGLSPQQIAVIHDMVYHQALSFKMAETRAKLFADAMVGSLVISNPSSA